LERPRLSLVVERRRRVWNDDGEASALSLKKLVQRLSLENRRSLAVLGSWVSLSSSLCII
jgi:hypothetical protein